MLLSHSFAAALAIMTSAAQVQAKAVFAHFMVGNTAGSKYADWLDDITKAADVGIDAFALNIAPGDSYTTSSINLAAQAAKDHGNFSLFLSFDYRSNGEWDAGVAANTINTFATTAGSAQYKYNGKPFVSTFEGGDRVGDWPTIKQKTGCFFVPDWSDLGPAGVAGSSADGGFSWDAWPAGNTDKDTTADKAWKTGLAGKPYLMPVSPWFYTNLPQWSKNWILRGDDLWSTRWNQVLEIQPEFVEILTWNDYGESHYIGPIRSPGIPTNANRYVEHNPHDHWRDLLPQYIAAYKTGAASSGSEKVVYYHRPNPSSSGSDAGTNSAVPGAKIISPAAMVSQEKVFVDALLGSAASIDVSIGGVLVESHQATAAGITHFSVPFTGHMGPVVVTVKRGSGAVVTASGTAISAPADGIINWNAVVGGSQKL